MSGSYWWPDLKPDTQPSYFDPESPVQLVDVELAHAMQKELALAFFDLTIRGDDSARARLTGFSADGLTLEMRNF